MIESDGTITYEPALNVNGADSFTYTIDDGTGGSATATVSVMITAVDDAPVVTHDEVTTDEDTAVTIAVLANDYDPEGDPVSLTAIDEVTNGTGVLLPDGTISYTPDPNFSGIGLVTYWISDAHGNTASSWARIVVRSVNDAPTAVDDVVATDEDTAVTIAALDNDSDPDGDSLSIVKVTVPLHGTASINADGTLEYRPEANYQGPDSFTYTVQTTAVALAWDASSSPDVTGYEIHYGMEPGVYTSYIDVGPVLSTVIYGLIEGRQYYFAVVAYDALTGESVPSAEIGEVVLSVLDAPGTTATATVHVTVTGTNDGPVAVADAVTTTEDTAVSVAVLANDSDLDGDRLSVTSVSTPAHGTAAINPDGTISYTPAANYVGVDSFVYTVSDGSGDTAEATVTVTITPTNDGPVAVDDAATTTEDTAVVVAVLTNDTDLDGDTLTVTSVATAAHGAATVNADGTIAYAPAANYHGADSFSYTIGDGFGGSATATVSVTVTPANDGPVAVDDAATTAEDTAVVVSVLTNDTDLDGDTLTVTSVGTAAHGAATVNADGTITYAPAVHYHGADSFGYTIGDGNGGTATATVTVAVTPTNDGPIAVNDGVTTAEDTAVVVAVLTNDTDLDGDTLTVTSVGTAAHGAATVNADGTITYAPAANYQGADSFSYTIGDGNGGSAPATVSVTVTPANDGPVAVDDAATTAEDTAVVVSVLTNDSDLDGDPLTVSAATAPAHGTATVNADGTIAYAPATNYHGADSFSYTIGDGNGGTATATVSVTVTPTNDGPVAVDDAATTAEDTAVSIAVLTNDSDRDGDTVTVTSATAAAHGTAVVNADGTITYTPAPNYHGADSFSYTIGDGFGGTGTATVSVMVTGVNDGPVAVDDAATTVEDTAISVAVLANDTDPDGDTLTVSPATAPAHGTATVNADGTITYTPAPNYHGADSFSYTIGDGNGASATATVTVTVTSTNDGPVAVDDAATTVEDMAVSIAVLPNDTDLEGDTVTVTSAAAAAHGTATVNANGTITYAPAANYHGLDTFSYTIGDGNGGSATATVTVTVTPTNDGPVAVDDAATTAEDTAVVVSILPNDTDLDDDTLMVSAATVPAHGTATVNADGTITYAPPANYYGADSFSYTAVDGFGGSATATVSVTVTPTNDGPVAVDDAVTSAEDTAVSIAVLANDTELDGDPLTVTSATAAAHGTAAVNADGTITYTPAGNYHGADRFTYTIGDGTGASATATVTVTVTPTNDGPVAVDDAATTVEDTAVGIAVLVNDSDLDGDTLSVTVASAPAHGTATVNADKTITYAPAANYHGADTFTYTSSDGQTGSATATVIVTVTATNDGPVAVADAAATAEDTSVSVTVLANDSDADGDTLSLVSVSAAAHGSAVVNPDGTITYSPAENYFGADSFTYTVGDSHGGTATATVTVTVASVNDGPTAVNDAATTPEDTAVSITVLSNDFDMDEDSLSVTAVSEPAHGAAAVDPDGTITYTPAANYHGADSFAYTVVDVNGGTATATVSVTVTPTNDGPVAADDAATTAEDTAVSIAVLANDSDLDGDALSVTGASAPAHGTAAVNPDGTIAYTPAANYHGADSFSYTIGDGSGVTASATVSVTVTSTNDGPVAVDDAAATAEDTAVVVSVLTNDSDLDGDTLSVSAATAPAHGTATVNADGTITYAPAANYHGADSFSYTVGDGNGGSATATVSVTVTPTNDGPVAVDDAATTAEDTAVIVSVLTNDTDQDGDTLTVSAAPAPAHGTATVTDGTITYTPAANYHGADSFSYTIGDGFGGTATATVSVTVTPANDGPVAVDDAATTGEDTAVSITVLTNDTDLDGDTLSVSSVSVPAHGTATINADGTLTYMPAANYHGADAFTYTLSDGLGGSATATVSVTVTPANDGPVAVDDAATTAEDTGVSIAVLTNDTDLDGDAVTVSAATAPAHGTALVNADGTITYAPAANYHGPDSFNYTVGDGNGGTATATVSVTVTPTNDGPVAVADAATTAEDTAVSLAVLTNDSDLDGDTLTVSAATTPAHGTATVNADGTITYAPAANYHGADSFTYTVSDGQGGSATATVSVTVTPTNDGPVAVNDTTTTPEDTAVTIAVLANDTDPDSATLSVTGIVGPAFGSAVINPDGTITYTPVPNDSGGDVFVYTVSDGEGGSALAFVIVQVTDVNDAPVAVNDAASTVEETAVSGTVLGNDTDLDDGTLTVTLGANPLNGTVTLAWNGSFTYTPNANFHGLDSFTYTASDGTAVSNVATVTITVTAVNDAPVAVNDTATTAEETPVNGSVLTNDTDVDGATTLTASLVANAANGSVTLASDGSFAYTPAANFAGSDSFTYTASDGTAVSNVATVTVTVTGVNDAPVAVDDSATTAEETPVSGSVLTNDTDVDGATTLTATLVSSPANGIVTLASDGSFTLTPRRELPRARQLHLYGERRDGGLERRDGDGHGHGGERRAGGGGRQRDDHGRDAGQRHGADQRHGRRRRDDADGQPGRERRERERDAGVGRQLHLYAERELRRVRQLHLHGERRNGGLERRDGDGHGHGRERRAGGGGRQRDDGGRDAGQRLGADQRHGRRRRDDADGHAWSRTPRAGA